MRKGLRRRSVAKGEYRLAPLEGSKAKGGRTRAYWHRKKAVERTQTQRDSILEAALDKIVEGRIGGFFKDVALLDQPYAKDDKQSVSQFIGSASIVAFAQVEIG